MPPSPSSNLASAFHLPQPSSSGSVDLSDIKPVSSGTVSIADAIDKARDIAAEKGVVHNGRARKSLLRVALPLKTARAKAMALIREYAAARAHARSRSRSPVASRRERERESFRDNYNPYRDERREDRRGAGPAPEPSFSLVARPRRGGAGQYSPPPARGYGARAKGSPARGGGAVDEEIQIDSSLVGLIIGRQGENLRRIERETGARVQFVGGPDGSGPTRGCKISGSPSARADAKKEIFRITEENGRPIAGIQTDVDGHGNVHVPHFREGEETVQIMVPERTVGLLIGRGGETIRELQERSKCHINIVGESKSAHGLRPVNLIGIPQFTARAKEYILEIVDSDNKSLANQAATAARDVGRGGTASSFDGGITGNFGGAGGSGADRVSDMMHVPSDAVGMIIGKGGETIKVMQIATGCRINVSHQTGSYEPEREVGLVGSREAVDRAKAAIEEKIDLVKRGGRGSAGDLHSDRPALNRGGYVQDQASETQQDPGAGSQSGVAVAAIDATDPTNSSYNSNKTKVKTKVISLDPRVRCDLPSS
ncbi:MAG: hypothetical protein M1826_007474 [Phylliscum demangeonii]|nr:MAG: hypothetical protein M1826_007474 [Phylliscum demangeonii]